MKKIQKLFLIILLFPACIIRADLQENMDYASYKLRATTWRFVCTALTIGLCSYLADEVLSNFQATADLKNRGSIATGSCLALYLGFLASAHYYDAHKNCKKDCMKEDQEVVE